MKEVVGGVRVSFYPHHKNFLKWRLFICSVAYTVFNLPYIGMWYYKPYYKKQFCDHKISNFDV